MKYALVGILMLLAAVGLYCATADDGSTDGDEVATAPPDAGIIQRQTQMQPEFEIPEEEPDLGVPDLGPAEPEANTMRVRQPRTCDGNLDVAAIRAVATRQQRQVRSCYERRLKVNNILQGTVNVRMVVGRTGSVDQVSVGGSLRDSEVFSCVRRLANTWEFPAVEGGSCAIVSIPFRMTPRP
ncbi:MAG: AgmX/PglI C-terminal domain-containing protein [Deltaproteobacteria bacterium]|nr:AgmX/PglI C-terminal domain-containing protein [Deltaproteobacteria bacterium]